MAIIQVKAEGISPEDMEKEKKQLTEFIETKKNNGICICESL